MEKIKQNKWIVIIVIVFIVFGFYFYWYEWRLIQISKKCNEQAIENSQAIIKSQFFQDIAIKYNLTETDQNKYDDLYKQCLREMSR